MKVFARTLLAGIVGTMAAATAGLVGCQTPDASSSREAWPKLFSSSQQGEQWTILCLELPGDTPRRQSTADRLAEALRKSEHIDATRLRLMHDEDASRLYYGTFRPAINNGTPDFTESDLAVVNYIRSLAVGATHPFLEARLVPVPTRDVGPPEWNIQECEGPYTLGVAEFYNEGSFTQRKQVAVQFCGLLREKGYEAFYWHGPRHSLVCVGSLKRNRDFIIRSDGILLSPELQEMVDEDPELKYKTVNGRYIVKKLFGQSVRQRALPVPCPDRPIPSNSDWLEQRNLQPLRE